MYSVVTGRFNNETLEANYLYRLKRNYQCIYCVPMELSPKISYDSPVFVIEMNNSTNKIEGIGLIKNKPEVDRYYKVHTEGNTNRYIYIGNYFIDKATIERMNPLLITVLEEILFKGKTHSKRGSGLTLLPEKILKFEICKDVDIKKDIRDLFIIHFRKNTINDKILSGCDDIQDN
jgi:hypothetical protein